MIATDEKMPQPGFAHLVFKVKGVYVSKNTVYITLAQHGVIIPVKEVSNKSMF